MKHILIQVLPTIIYMLVVLLLSYLFSIGIPQINAEKRQEYWEATDKHYIVLKILLLVLPGLSIILSLLCRYVEILKRFETWSEFLLTNGLICLGLFGLILRGIKRIGNDLKQLGSMIYRLINRKKILEKENADREQQEQEFRQRESAEKEKALKIKLQKEREMALQAKIAREKAERKKELKKIKSHYTEDEFNLLMLICNTVLDGGETLPNREEIRQALRIAKNKIPGLISRFENEGKLKATGAGAGQKIFILMDEDEASAIMELIQAS